MASQREEAFYILGIATGCIIAGVMPYVLMYLFSTYRIFVLAVSPIFLIGLGVLVLIIGYFYKGCE
jgi:hypothetical protein